MSTQKFKNTEHAGRREMPMTDQEKQEFLEAMQPAVDELTGIRDEVRKISDDNLTVKTEIEDMVRDLQHQRETDSNPDDEHVLRVEEELKALRKESNDLKKAILETREAGMGSRVVKANPWEGAFIQGNIDEFKDVVRTQGMAGLQSRALTSGTTLASAGKLTNEQLASFLDWMREKQQALSRVVNWRMASHTTNLDELVTATRQMIAATEASAPAVADGFTTARRQLTSVEVIWAEDISFSFIEDNLEQGDIESHISRNLAMAFGRDSNDLFWNGDEDNTDAFLGINDGIIDIAKADGSVVDYDATSVLTWQAVFNDMMKLLDWDFVGLGDLAFFVMQKGIFVYANELKDRATSLGDSTLINGPNRTSLELTYFGVPVVGEPHLEVAGTEDEVVLSPLQNLYWGFWRDITVNSDIDFRKRVVEYTVHARTDQNYAKSTAVVLGDNIESALRT